MSLIEIIVLAVVQGLTEFLPISSTAHLRIVPALLGWQDPGAAFSAVIQIGTLLAVLTYFWRDVVRIAVAMLVDFRAGKIAGSGESRMGWMIVVGTIPIVVCGIAFRGQIETSARLLYVVSAALAVVAILLAIAEAVVVWRRFAGIDERGMDEVCWRDALVVGLAQAAALIPGTSRSGATILGGLASGLSRETAARFSFLLSIPSISAAGIYQLIEARNDLLAGPAEAAKLAVGLVVTGAVGYATIPWLLAFLRRRSTYVFIVYRLLLAGLIVALLAAGKLSEY
jgi:undecaprenyl-diphosphatase